MAFGLFTHKFASRRGPEHGTRLARLCGMLTVVGALCAQPAAAYDVGTYEMCTGEGNAQLNAAVTASGNTPITLTDLTAADLAPVAVIFVTNCSNTEYGAEYLSRLDEIAHAVDQGKVLVLHDRYVDPAETILPGGADFDIRRITEFPDPNNEARDIDVRDGTTAMTNGPGGTITNTTLDNGNFSDHGFAIAGTLPPDARLILSTNDPDHIVTFAYGYGSGAVIYSSIPLDHYLSGNAPAAFSTVYGPNVASYAAQLAAGPCGNGILEVGEECDIGGANGTHNCCSFDCRVRPSTSVCREAAGECDTEEFCNGVDITCPANQVLPAATECRSSAGVCDPAEACDGSSVDCPADQLAPPSTVCRSAVDECDLAETCTGLTADCPADVLQPPLSPCSEDGNLCTADQCDGAGTCEHVAKPDTDSDGVCDEQDACNNTGGQDFVVKPKPQLSFTKINTDVVPGNDGLKLTAEFTLGSGSFASLDNVGQGARIVVLNGSGTASVDQTLPGGTYGGRGTRGWKSNRAGTQWQYLDTTGAPLSGITRFNIINRTTATKPRRVKVVITGVRSTYPITGADLPLQPIVVLGDSGAASAGLCGETAFVGSQCQFNKKGNALRCKK